ncbi:MAG: PQQ-binding-like beta-propeller repeat protein [Planctomycetes bacterium]|nr:PQQ-binding-like beta-propeller repeat protein [Planctomycetota bacterium]
MTARTALLALLLGTTTLARADDPKPEPLPEGAKLRLGGPPFGPYLTTSFQLLPPDYKAIALPDGTNSLRRFDLAGRSLDKTAPRPRFPGTGDPEFVMSADGKRWVFVQSADLSVRDAATGEVVKRLVMSKGFRTVTEISGLSAVSLSTDGKFLAQGATGQGVPGQPSKGGVIVWDVEKGESVFQTGVPLGGLGLPVLSPDGKLVAVRGTLFSGGLPKPGEEDHRYTFAVYEVDGGKELLRGQATPGGLPGTGIATVAFSPDGSAVAVSCGDGVVDLFDVRPGKPRASLLGRNSQGQHIAFSPDGKTLAAVAEDGSLQRWNTANGKPLGTTEGPQVGINSPRGLAFVGNERVLAWGFTGRYPVVWESPSGKVLTPVPELTSGIKSIAFAGEKEIVTSGMDGRVVRWDTATGKAIGQVELRPTTTPLQGTSRFIVDLTPDGKKAITNGAARPAVAVLDVATGTEELLLPRKWVNGYTATTILSADRTKLVEMRISSDMTKRGTCVVWDLVDRKKLISVELPVAVGNPPHADVSPNGKRLVTIAYQPNPAGGQRTLIVTGWDLKTGKKLGEVEDAKTGWVAFVSVAGDSLAVVHSGTGRLRAFDYESGRGGDIFEEGKAGGEHIAGPVVFNPGGKQFASSAPGNEPGTYVVKFRDWPTGKVLHTFPAHRALISAMTFSPDGKSLATGAMDGTVLLWDLAVK